MNAILLARVSTDEQVDALPAQTQRLTKYAQENGYDYRLIEFQESAYRDEGRRKFAEIVDVIRSYKDTVIVVFDKIDRYSRELSSEQTKVFQKMLNDGKIEMHFPSDNLFVHKNSPAADLFRLGIGIVLAKYYSDAISDNVKRKLEQKLKDGEWIGKAPLGYVNSVLPDGKKWVVVSSYEAEAVRSAYEWYSTGSFSFKLVRNKLSQEFAIDMSNSQLEKILKNPFYYGEMQVKDNLYPHRYKPIIDKGLFDEVQAVKKGYKKQPFKYAGLPFYYRGLLRCAACGCSLTPERKKAKYVYYHCSQYKGKHGAKWIREEQITEDIKSIFLNLQISDADYKTVSQELKTAHKQKVSMYEEMLSTLNTEFEKYQSRLEKLYEDYLDEKITETLYDKKFKEYRQKQRVIRKRIDNLDEVEKDYYASVNHLLRISRSAPVLFERSNIEQRRQLVNLILQNLTHDGDSLRWELKRPFETVFSCIKSSTWLRGEDSNLRPIG